MTSSMTVVFASSRRIRGKDRSTNAILGIRTRGSASLSMAVAWPNQRECESGRERERKRERERERERERRETAARTGSLMRLLTVAVHSRGADPSQYLPKIRSARLTIKTAKLQQRAYLFLHAPPFSLPERRGFQNNLRAVPREPRGTFIAYGEDTPAQTAFSHGETYGSGWKTRMLC